VVGIRVRARRLESVTECGGGDVLYVSPGRCSTLYNKYYYYYYYCKRTTMMIKTIRGRRRRGKRYRGTATGSGS